MALIVNPNPIIEVLGREFPYSTLLQDLLGVTNCHAFFKLFAQLY